MAQIQSCAAIAPANSAKRVKLTGRAFYESIGSPKMIVAPMVDRSEFAWRLLTRSYLDEERSKLLLAYTPMLHARLFKEQVKVRDSHFQPTRESLTSTTPSTAPPYLDGRPDVDRPLFVQFCANNPEDLFEAARYVAPYCDAVDLNLGCPQGIAKNGRYGAFLQEDWQTIHKLIRRLRDGLDVPVTAKMRILENKEKTLDYAKMILDAGASILTVHGRQRHQKGHHTGIADWEMIRFLRDNLPPETVLFANGNILNSRDLEPCLQATGADGVMSAEGNLSDPTIFAKPPLNNENREYWRDSRSPGIEGYRIDGVLRRYMDIIYRYVLEQEPPQREPLYLPGDAVKAETGDTTLASANGTSIDLQPSSGVKRTKDDTSTNGDQEHIDGPKSQKKQKKSNEKRQEKKNMAAVHNPNLKSMQGHLFQLLRPMLNNHTHIRDALARSRAGDISAFENVLSMVEEAIKTGLDEERNALHVDQEQNKEASLFDEDKQQHDTDSVHQVNPKELEFAIDTHSSEGARERCKRPFWICQPHVRPLPEEAIKLGAITIGKKDKNLFPSLYNEQKSQAAIAEAAQKQNSSNIQKIRKELPQEEALACG